MLYTQKSAQKYLGNSLVLIVDPGLVRYHAGPDRPLTKVTQARLAHIVNILPGIIRLNPGLVSRLHPFVLRARSYPQTNLFSRSGRYQKVKEVVHKHEKYNETAWYRELMAGLDEHGRVSHKKIIMKSAADVDVFFRNYVLKMIQSISVNGYDFEKGSDFGTAMIGPDGAIHKSSKANHRFIVARELGVKRFPLVIKCVHEEWVKSRGLSRLIPDKERWLEALADVEMMHI